MARLYLTWKDGSGENGAKRPLDDTVQTVLAAGSLSAMTKKSRGREKENQRWHDRHAHEQAVATRAAERQRHVPDGMHVVALPLLERDLDRANPRIPVVERFTVALAPPSFSQPSFSREKEMSPATYISPNRITLHRVETINPKTGKKTGAFGLRGLKLPPDVVRRLIDRVDGIVLEVELNDDGILFRPAGVTTNPISLPAWVPLKK